MQREFKVGDRVTAPAWGDGDVIHLDPQDKGNNQIQVRFGNCTPWFDKQGFINIYPGNERHKLKHLDEEQTVRKIDPEKIRTKVAAMSSVCAKGKEEILDLLEEVTGETLKKPKAPEMKAGQVYRYNGDVLRIIVSNPVKNGELFAATLSGAIAESSHALLTRNLESGIYIFVANSLKEYIEQGGKL